MTFRPTEVIFEFRRIGAFVKVSAIDPGSNVEVSIVGAANASQQYLKMTAIRKLQLVLSRGDHKGKVFGA